MQAAVTAGLCSKGILPPQQSQHSELQGKEEEREEEKPRFSQEALL